MSRMWPYWHKTPLQPRRLMLIMRRSVIGYWGQQMKPVPHSSVTLDMWRGLQDVIPNHQNWDRESRKRGCV